MSNYQTRDNSGALFKNEEKRNEKGPDYSGSCVVDGADYFFDAWLKTAESGRKYMSFSFKKKDKQAAAQPRTVSPAHRTHGDRPGGPYNRPQPSAGFDDADDIPF